MSEDLGKHYLETALREFRTMKKQAEKAIAQLRDDQLNQAIDREANSVAVLVKHIAGNMRSRWTDFLASDGEKPDRNRDAEFEGALSRGELLEAWERGWALVFGAIEPLGPSDLLRKVTIRGEAHTVVQAIDRQLTHYAAHIGQIVFLAKHLAGDQWTSLSIPRGQSAAFGAKPRPM